MFKCKDKMLKKEQARCKNVSKHSRRKVVAKST